MRKIIRSQAGAVVRSRWLLMYGAFFFLLSEGTMRFSGSAASALLTLAMVSLLVIPLATLVLVTMHVYGARELIELLLAQPIRRGDLYAGIHLGLALPMAGAFLAGVTLPFAVRGALAVAAPLAVLLAMGATLTLVFTAIAFCIALGVDDRLRGMALAMSIWLLVAVVYDGAVLTVVALAGEHSMERPLLGLMVANPVDLARVLLLRQLDAAALLGYTGAAFERLFAGARGAVLASAALGLWVAVPVFTGARLWRRKDF